VHLGVHGKVDNESGVFQAVKKLQGNISGKNMTDMKKRKEFLILMMISQHGIS
jgi:hypothetical protein